MIGVLYIILVIIGFGVARTIHDSLFKYHRRYRQAILRLIKED